MLMLDLATYNTGEPVRLKDVAAADIRKIP